MKEKEFEKQQLEQLISDLKNIDKYTSFKNGAFIYDLGKYQGSLLVNEIERLNNIINELEKWLKKICEQEIVFEDGDDYCTERAYGCRVCLDKIQELKENNK